MTKRARQTMMLIAAGVGALAAGLLARGLAPELVRYFRIKKM